jgi:two-component system, NarL family, nitrate/nitrite response regulator NarL
VEHTPPRLRVLLVDDQALFRRALATLISAQHDMTVVGEGEHGRDALDKVRALHPDLVVMDVNMPDASGVDGVNAIRQAGITTPIVMLTVSEDDDDLFESIKAGANGYLLKNVRPEQLFEDLRGVMRGEAPIAPAVASKLLEALRTGGIPARGQAAAAAQDSILTRRESEILELVSQGLSNKEIANKLTITEGTVKNHVHNALEKLHLTNRVQAAAYAVRLGYTRPENDRS